jgi:hypothetical protein
MSHEHGTCMSLPCDPVIPGPLIIIPTAFNWRVAEVSTELVTLPPFLSVYFRISSESPCTYAVTTY